MKPSCVALGFFDGVHIAHKKIIEDCVSIAKEKGLVPIVLTFNLSPLEILSSTKPKYITTFNEKKVLIEKLGCNFLSLTLSKDLLSMSAEDFATEILVKEYNAKHIVCGFNYRFGKNGEGDALLLKELGRKYGFGVSVIEQIFVEKESVSSTNIRQHISEGNIKKANEMLGRNFSICGVVEKGKHLGSSLGFPTANIVPDESANLPKNGVYKTYAIIDGKRYKAITNVGINPTVGKEKKHTETFILDFSENLYRKEIRIEFIHFIRDEMAFSDIEKLKEQIKKDVEKAEI